MLSWRARAYQRTLAPTERLQRAWSGLLAPPAGWLQKKADIFFLLSCLPWYLLFSVPSPTPCLWAWIEQYYWLIWLAWSTNWIIFPNSCLLIANLASNCKSKQIALCYKYISVSKLFEFWREKDVAIFAPNLRSSILECVMPGQDDRLVILKLENVWNMLF